MPERVVDGVIEYVNNSIGQMIAAVDAEDYEIATLIRDDLNRKLNHVKRKLLKANLTLLTEEEIDIVFQTLKNKFIIDWCEYLEIDPNKHIEGN